MLMSQEVSKTGSLRVFPLRHPDTPSLVPSRIRTLLGLPIALPQRLNFINRLPAASGETGNERNPFPAAILPTGNTLGRTLQRPWYEYREITWRAPFGACFPPRLTCEFELPHRVYLKRRCLDRSSIYKDMCKPRSDSVETIA